MTDLAKMYRRGFVPALFRPIRIGHLDTAAFEIEFWEGVVAAAPGHVGALRQLGHAYTQRGDYEKGLVVDRRLASLRPHDPVAHYNLTCSLSLTGRLDEAFDALRRAVEVGYSDFEHLRKDPDLAWLREDPRYEPFVAAVRA